MPASLENSAVATGLEKVSFHSKRRAMQKNVQTTIQLYSSHMLARLGSKSFKPRLDSVVKSKDITLLTKAHIIKLWFFQ